MAHPGGRPTLYTKEIAEEICDEIASSSKGLDYQCNIRKHWPNARTVRRWVRNNTEFCQMYAQARLDQADFLAEEILEIADDVSNDTIIKIDSEGNEKEVCNSEWIARSRLRVDTRKWLAAKFAPRTYGDKVFQDHDVKVKQEESIKDLE